MTARLNRAVGAVAACGLLLSLSACGDPAPEPDAPLNAMGSSGGAGPISLRNVYVLGAPDGRYTAGEDARVRLTLINDGSKDDALVKVTSEAASAASLHWDRACDGTAESVDRIEIVAGGLVPQDPLRTSTTTAPSDTQKPAQHQPYYIKLTVDEEILKGTTVPITFTFEHAGTVTVEAIVQSRHSLDEQAEFACIAGAAAQSQPADPTSE